MIDQPMPGFGDRVRIRSTPVAEAAGIAGLEGVVYGESVPSSSGVQVVGLAPDDYVLNVHVEASGEEYWLAPEHVELVDHNAGVEIRLDGVPKRWVRRADGAWDEIADPDAQAPGAVRREPGLWHRLRSWMKR